MGQTRHCKSCGQTKSLEEFGANKTKPHGRHYTCKNCRKEYAKQWYYNHKDLHVARVKVSKDKRNDMLRSKMVEYLCKHPCVDCGESDPVVLEFDHFRDKSANVSDLLRKGHPWETIIGEIEKCVVRCANCHRRKTAKQFNWKRLETPKEEGVSGR